MNKPPIVENCETKLIAGVRHIRVLCNDCKELVWTQLIGAKKNQIHNYVCNTCRGDK